MQQGIWACHLCQSKNKQAVCCQRRTCEYSTFRTTEIERMIAHMIEKHGFKAPKGFDTTKYFKKKKNEKKRERKRRRNERGKKER